MPPSDHAETVDLGHLPDVWSALYECEARMDAADKQYLRTNVLCDRRFDEAKGAGERTYILAHSSIVAARDSHRALVQSIQHGGVRGQGTWGMIRPSFEAAFYAV